MILQVCTTFTLCHNRYISLEMFCFFCCWVLCSLSSLRFPDETQLSTARAASNSVISGLFTSRHITSHHVIQRIIRNAYFFVRFLLIRAPTCTATDCHQNTQEYQHAVNIITNIAIYLAFKSDAIVDTNLAHTLSLK